MAIVLVLGASQCATYAADTPLEKYAKALKGQRFILRAHDELFGTPTFSVFDGRRIQEARVVSIFNGSTASIADVADWEGSYFVPETSWTVRDVDVDRKRGALQVKLWGPPIGSLEAEVKLEFTSIEGLTVDSFNKQLWFKLFFDPKESVSAYVATNNAKLLEKYLDPLPELFILPQKERENILSAIRLVSPLSGKPKIERVGEELFIPADMVGDGIVYNDLQVSKNVRIASSIEGLVPRIKTAALGLNGLPSAIKGVRYYWTVVHHDFVNEKNSVHSERIELLASIDSIKELEAGNLSVLEVLQKSILRVDGTKITMTSYEPIGNR